MSLAKRIDDLEATASMVNNDNYTVYGLVCPKEGHTHSISNKTGSWSLSQEEPTVYIPAKMERAVTSTKRYVIIIGGRGSGKSIVAADIALCDAKDTGSKTYFLREYQSSIEHSVYSLLSEEIARLEIDDGFRVLDRKILFNGRNVCNFAGISRNVDSIKSAHGFKRFSIEEAQFITTDSLKALTPTARQKAKKGLPTKLEDIVIDPLKSVSLMFVANPSSTEDPFSQRFIVPFITDIERDGFYEDDLHLIIKMNYDDNPWFAESGLQSEMDWDKKHTSPAMFRHVWHGGFNDSVENALIMSEWFDACTDAHIKKEFKALGLKKAAHDPSDTGGDSKSYAEIHGSVITFVAEKPDGDVNEGGDWAATLAVSRGVDTFTWDCDGMGVALNRQMGTAFHKTKIALSQFKGSETPDLPDAIYDYTSLTAIQNQKTWKETVRNKRAQNYLRLRERIYKTYRFVVFNEHCDVEDLISFDSNIECLDKLRSELCRMPVKPSKNGFFELYTKEVMKTKFGLVSPNLADGVMMLMKHVEVISNKAVHIPRPVKPRKR